MSSKSKELVSRPDRRFHQKPKKKKKNKTKKRELQPGSEVYFEIKNWTTWVHTSVQER
jgi:hypothetical protein